MNWESVSIERWQTESTFRETRTPAEPGAQSIRPLPSLLLLFRPHPSKACVKLDVFPSFKCGERSVLTARVEPSLRKGGEFSNDASVFVGAIYLDGSNDFHSSARVHHRARFEWIV